MHSLLSYLLEGSSPLLNALFINYYLAWLQTELEAAKSEIQKWHSSFQNEPCLASGTSPG